jgi:hypothetical protein
MRSSEQIPPIRRLGDRLTADGHIAARPPGKALFAALACLVALLGSAVPAAAETRVQTPRVTAGCYGNLGPPGLNWVEIRPEAHVTAIRPEGETGTGPYFYLQSKVKLRERYGRKWKRRPKRTVRGPAQPEGTLTYSDSSAFPVLRRTYRSRALNGPKRLRAVKGTATLEVRNVGTGALLAAVGPLRFSEKFHSSSIPGFGSMYSCAVSFGIG